MKQKQKVEIEIEVPEGYKLVGYGRRESPGYCLSNVTGDVMFCESHSDTARPIIEKESWEDTVSRDNPCLCWVSDINKKPDNTNQIAVIAKECTYEGFVAYGLKKYISNTGRQWGYATPLTKEEIDVFINCKI